MKHLKSLLTAYRITTPHTTAAISDSIDSILEVVSATLAPGSELHVDADRVRKILVAVIKDMRAEDEKAAKAAADKADTAAM